MQSSPRKVFGTASSAPFRWISGHRSIILISTWNPTPEETGETMAGAGAAGAIAARALAPSARTELSPEALLGRSRQNNAKDLLSHRTASSAYQQGLSRLTLKREAWRDRAASLTRRRRLSSRHRSHPGLCQQERAVACSPRWTHPEPFTQRSSRRAPPTYSDPFSYCYTFTMPAAAERPPPPRAPCALGRGRPAATRGSVRACTCTRATSAPAGD